MAIRRAGPPVFSMNPDGGPTLEASWSLPTLKKVIALSFAMLSLDGPSVFMDEEAAPQILLAADETPRHPI